MRRSTNIIIVLKLSITGEVDGTKRKESESSSKSVKMVAAMMLSHYYSG